MNAALLVVDLQKGFIKNYPCYPNLDLTLEYVNGAVDLFLEHGLPVVVVKDVEAKDEDFPKPFDLIDGLDLKGKDFDVVEKSQSNSFWNTNLEDLLKSKEIDFIVISGFAAEYCVYATYQGAKERGFHALVLKNGITSQAENYSKMIQDITNNISFFTLAKLLSQ